MNSLKGKVLNLVLVEGGTQRVSIPLQGRVQVGRAAGNTLQVADGRVSSRHFEIVVEGDRCLLRDLGSTNGTWVNGKQVRECPVSEGDQIRVGPAVLLISRDGDPNRITRPMGSDSPVPERTELQVRGKVRPIGPEFVVPEGKSEVVKKRLKLLYDLSRAMQEADGLSGVLEKAADGLREILGGDLCVIFDRVPDGEGESGDVLRMVAKSFGKGVSAEVAVSRTIIQRTLDEGEAVLTDDAREDERFEASMSIAGYGIRSALSVPLQGRSGILGAVVVQTFSPLHKFTSEDLEFLASMAVQVGISVENAKLFFELEANNRKLREAYDELKGMDKLRDDFMALVSHELRTPLTAILITVEGILDGTITPQDFPEILPGVSQEVQRLSRVLGQFYDLNLLESGRVTMDFAPCKPAELAAAAWNEVAPLAEKKRVRLETTLPDVRVTALSRWMTQALANLLDNAVRYGPEEGTVRVRGELEGSAPGLLRVYIEDEGPGIPEGKRGKVMTKFGHIENIDHHAEGLGLGLPLAGQVIRMHRGRLWIEDGPSGKGSSVRLEIPIRQSAPGEA
jgi:signal transduction histidine kinase